MFFSDTFVFLWWRLSPFSEYRLMSLKSPHTVFSVALVTNVGNC